MDNFDVYIRVNGYSQNELIYRERYLTYMLKVYECLIEKEMKNNLMVTDKLKEYENKLEEVKVELDFVKQVMEEKLKG